METVANSPMSLQMQVAFFLACQSSIDRWQMSSTDIKSATRTGGKERKKNEKKLRTTCPSANHLDAFFAQYPAFSYDPKSSSSTEFYRLCDFFDWDRDDPEREDAHDIFKTALVQQFNSLYGTEVDDIESWRELSLALDIVPLPDDLRRSRRYSLNSRFMVISLCKDGADSAHRCVRANT